MDQHREELVVTAMIHFIQKLMKAVRTVPVVQLMKRTIAPPPWQNLRSTSPVSQTFGLDRGTPIDRYYIEQFLTKHKNYIAGRVIEIAENTYSKKFSQPGSQFEILHVNTANRTATIIGDLTQPDSLPENIADCFICTQTLNFIFDVKAAVSGIHRMLKNKGTALVTVAGISQISRYDMDRWGDYWRFTTKSVQHLFEDIFGAEYISVESYGNVLSSVAFLEGISAEELTPAELDIVDNDYQLLITIRATKQ
jgi:hypothetical protein